MVEGKERGEEKRKKHMDDCFYTSTFSLNKSKTANVDYRGEEKRCVLIWKVRLTSTQVSSLYPFKSKSAKLCVLERIIVTQQLIVAKNKRLLSDQETERKREYIVSHCKYVRVKQTK